jgi:hypothetical protein
MINPDNAAIVGGILSTFFCAVYSLFEYFQWNEISRINVTNHPQQIDPNNAISLCLVIGFSISMYKLMELSFDWFKSSCRAVTYVSSLRYYCGMLVAAVFISAFALFMTRLDVSINYILALILVAQALSAKAAMRICLNKTMISWSKAFCHILFVLSYSLSEMVMTFYHGSFSCTIYLDWNLLLLVGCFLLVCWELEINVTIDCSFSCFRDIVFHQKPEVILISIFLAMKILYNIYCQVYRDESMDMTMFTLVNLISYNALVLSFSEIPHYMLFEKFYSSIVSSLSLFPCYRRFLSELMLSISIGDLECEECLCELHHA